jgi:hypothetical protein
VTECLQNNLFIEPRSIAPTDERVGSVHGHKKQYTSVCIYQKIETSERNIKIFITQQTQVSIARVFRQQHCIETRGGRRRNKVQVYDH